MKMRKYKALVMDFDLTIADTCGIITQCLLDTAREFGFDAKAEDMKRGIGCLPRDIFRIHAGVTDPSLAKRMETRYYENSHEQNYNNAKFFPGVSEGLRLLRERGVRAAIFSQKERELIIAPLKRERIFELIDMIVSIDDVENTKPNPEGMSHICCELGIKNSEILYTGDALTDEKTARAARVDFVPMLCGVTPAEAFDASFSVGMYDDFYKLCRDITQKAF